MINENGFDLYKLTMAVHEAHALLMSPDLDETSRSGLHTWWHKRESKVVRQLEQKLIQPASARQQLFWRMGAFVLRPDQARQERVLQEALSDYSNDLIIRLNELKLDVEGHVRPRRDGRSLKVIGEQVEDLRGLEKEIRSVLYGWEEGRRRLQVPIYEDRGLISQLRDTQLTDTRNAIREFSQLEDVVTFVDDKLRNAYTEDQADLWAAIDQRLDGNRNIPNRSEDKGQPWVPVGLKAHVSLNWIREAKSQLKQRRNNLNTAMLNLTWCILYEGEEAGNPAVGQPSGVAVPAATADGRLWVKRFVTLQTNTNRNCLEQDSVLEQAADLLRMIKSQAELQEYPEYSDGTAESLVEELERRLKDNGVEFDGSTLERYLASRNQEVQSLRLKLLPIVGGKLKTGEEEPPLALYKSAFRSTVEQVQRAEFEEAADDCTTGSLELTNAIMQLFEISVHGPSVKSAMAGRLVREAARVRVRLQQEKDDLSRLEERIGALRGDYSRYQEDFASNLQEYYRRQGDLRFRFCKNWGESYRTSALSAFCKCRVICPDDAWVQGWLDRLPPLESPECQPLPEPAWIKKYLHGLADPTLTGAP